MKKIYNLTIQQFCSKHFSYLVAFVFCSVISTLVNAQCTIGLLSGSDAQAICLGSTITTIVYNVSGTTAYALGLPSGVSSDYNSNVFTISGTPTAGGNYTYSVITTGGCAPDTVTGFIDINPVGTVSGGTIVCQNDVQPAITFTGAYGTPPYTFTYNINNGANQQIVTSAGSSITIYAATTTANTFNYNLVNVEDATTAACAISGQSSSIVVNALPIANISGSATVCQFEADPIITFTGGNGASPYTFSYYINNGAEQYLQTSGSNVATLAVSTSNPATATYTLDSVTYTNGVTCTSYVNQYVTVEVDRSSYAYFGSTPWPVSNELTITFLDSSVANNWTWYFGDGSYSTYQNPVHEYTDAGVYRVKLVVSNGVCGSDSSYQTVDILYDIAGISEINQSSAISISPNPSSGIFNVTSQALISTVEVMNATGQTVLTKQVNASTTGIDLSSQPKGLYFYKITGVGGTSGTDKLIVQ